LGGKLAKTKQTIFFGAIFKRVIGVANKMHKQIQATRQAAGVDFSESFSQGTC
jgi:hypothetical protein